MKKMVALLSGIVLLLGSCSSDDAGSGQSDNVLVKKVVSVDADGVEGMTFNYSYAGNKINTVSVSNGQKVVYFYTGNLITKTERYLAANGPLELEAVFQYDANERLVKEEMKYFMDSSLTTRNYTHETDGSVSFLEYAGEIGSITELVSTGKYFFNADKEVVKFQATNVNSNLTTTTNFTYDNQNSAFKNVLGWGKIFSNLTGKTNNVLTSTIVAADDVVLDSYSNQYEYNTQGYPTSNTTTIGSTTNKVNYFY